MPLFLDNYNGLATHPILEYEEEESHIIPHHDLQPVQINPDPPDLLPLIPEDEGDWLNLTPQHDFQLFQNNPDPPDPIPEVQPDSQPPVSGPMTRSRRKKQQSKVNIWIVFLQIYQNVFFPEIYETVQFCKCYSLYCIFYMGKVSPKQATLMIGPNLPWNCKLE